MANIYSTGPAHIFIGRVPNDTVAEFTVENMFYLGTFENSPKIVINNLSEDVLNDIGGDAPIATLDMDRQRPGGPCGGCAGHEQPCLRQLSWRVRTKVSPVSATR